MIRYHQLLISQSLNYSGLLILDLWKSRWVESSIIPLILFHGLLTLRLKQDNYKVGNTSVLLNTWLRILLVYEECVISLKPIFKKCATDEQWPFNFLRSRRTVTLFRKSIISFVPNDDLTSLNFFDNGKTLLSKWNFVH